MVAPVAAMGVVQLVNLFGQLAPVFRTLATALGDAKTKTNNKARAYGEVGLKTASAEAAPAGAQVGNAEGTVQSLAQKFTRVQQQASAAGNVTPNVAKAVLNDVFGSTQAAQGQVEEAKGALTRANQTMAGATGSGHESSGVGQAIAQGLKLLATAAEAVSGAAQATKVTEQNVAATSRA